jgi:hypothetical protein
MSDFELNENDKKQIAVLAVGMAQEVAVSTPYRVDAEHAESIINDALVAAEIFYTKASKYAAS